jgi:hypothetical protein
VTNWLTTKVSNPPTTAKPVSNTSATAPARGAPWRSSQSTAGTSRAVAISASATGTTTTPKRRISCRTATAVTSKTSSRHDQAAACLTRGATDRSSPVSAMDAV